MTEIPKYPKWVETDEFRNFALAFNLTPLGLYLRLINPEITIDFSSHPDLDAFLSRVCWELIPTRENIVID